MDCILRTVSSGATKTRIMYKAYLSYSQLKEYISFLEGNQLIHYEEGAELYRITEKGLKFMNAYDEIRELVSGDEKNSLSLSEQEVAPNSLNNPQLYSF